MESKLLKQVLGAHPPSRCLLLPTCLCTRELASEVVRELTFLEVGYGGVCFDVRFRRVLTTYFVYTMDHGSFKCEQIVPFFTKKNLPQGI